jgi:hypothetical protein
MAMAIMGGLSVATFLTLINLPALYVILFRVKPPVAERPSQLSIKALPEVAVADLADVV